MLKLKRRTVGAWIMANTVPRKKEIYQVKENKKQSGFVAKLL